jgi:hypothetical protein
LQYDEGLYVLSHWISVTLNLLQVELQVSFIHPLVSLE